MKEKIRKEIISDVAIILIALAIGLFLNKYVIANAQVPSSSMETTVMAGDRIFVNQIGRAHV